MCDQIRKSNPGELPEYYVVFISNRARTVR